MFTIDAHPDSGSESDCEIPQYHLPAFEKYGSSSSKNIPFQKKPLLCKKRVQRSSVINAGHMYNKSTYITMDLEKETVEDKARHHNSIMKKVLDETSKKSIVFQPEFEKLEKVTPFVTEQERIKLKKAEREKTKGYDWFDMPLAEMTEEKKNDLMILQMRKALDPKRFYKKSSITKNPKYFQVGTIVECPVDFYASRVPKKQRKQTILEELMADEKFKDYQKKKFVEYQESLPKRYRPQGKKMPNRQRANEARSAAMNYQKRANRIKKRKTD